MTPTIDVESARAAFEAAQAEVNAAAGVLKTRRAELQAATNALFDAQLDYDVKVVIRDAAATVFGNAVVAKLGP